MISCVCTHRKQLPAHDIDFDSYRCGSENINRDLYLWGAVLVCSLLSVGVVYYVLGYADGSLSVHASTITSVRASVDRATVPGTTTTHRESATSLHKIPRASMCMVSDPAGLDEDDDAIHEDSFTHARDTVNSNGMADVGNGADSSTGTHANGFEMWQRQLHFISCLWRRWHSVVVHSRSTSTPNHTTCDVIDHRNDRQSPLEQLTVLLSRGTLLLWLVYVPVYIALSFMYGSYEEQFVWSVSAIYLRGRCVL